MARPSGLPAETGPAAPHTYCSGGLMTKMAFFLFGFLALTIAIGALATISPT